MTEKQQKEKNNTIIPYSTWNWDDAILWFIEFLSRRRKVYVWNNGNMCQVIEEKNGIYCSSGSRGQGRAPYPWSNFDMVTACGHKYFLLCLSPPTIFLHPLLYCLLNYTVFLNWMGTQCALLFPSIILHTFLAFWEQ